MGDLRCCPGAWPAGRSAVEPYLRADGTRIWSLMQLERQLRRRIGGTTQDLAASWRWPSARFAALDEEPSPCMLMLDLAW
jgi:hypothetical protein